MTATKATTNPIKSLSYKRISNDLGSEVNLSHIMERIGDQRKRVCIKPGYALRLEQLAISKHVEKRTNELGHEERKRNGNRSDQTLLATQSNRHTAAGKGTLFVSSIAMRMSMGVFRSSTS